MIRSLQVALLLAAGALLLPGQPVSFRDKIYPILEKAGCRNCHNVEGVASATRLHFPVEDADIARVDAFGKSLVELVDRQNPANSLLLVKPTLRIPHTGGERIRKGSAEEAALKSWIGYLAKLSGSGVDRGASLPAGGGRRIRGRRQSGAAAPDSQPVQQYGARPAEGFRAIRRASFRPKITSTASRTSTRRCRCRRFWPRLTAGPRNGWRRTRSAEEIRAA